MHLNVRLSILTLACSFCFSITGFAAANSLNSLTYQGRIIKSDGSGLENASVSFLFEVTSPNGLCVIYREQVNGINMVGSGGVFDVPIGSGSRQYPLTAFTLSQAFNNSQNLTCDGGSIYTPLFDDVRILRVQFYDGSGWKAITPSSEIRSVPYAFNAFNSSTLAGHLPTDFVLKSTLSTCAVGQYLTFDGTSFTCQNDAGGAGMLSDINVTAPLTKGGTASLPTIGISVGSAAGTVAAGNDARFGNALRIQNTPVDATAPTSNQVLKFNGTNYVPSSLAISDIASLSTQLNNKINATMFPTSCTAGQSLVFVTPANTFDCYDISITAAQISGTIPVAKITGLQTSLDGKVPYSQMPSCTGAQVWTFVSPAGGFTCSNIAIGGSQISDGSITAAKLDSTSVGLWSASGSNVYRSSGNVGIGTASPAGPLHVVGVSVLGRSSTTYTGTNAAAVLGNASNSPGLVFDAPNLANLSWNNNVFSFSKCSDSTCNSSSPYFSIDTTTNMATFSNTNSVRAGNGNGNPAAPTYSFSTSTTSGMYSPAANNLSFATTSNERIRINANGDVGIGTTAPGARVEVAASSSGVNGMILSQPHATNYNAPFMTWKNSGMSSNTTYSMRYQGNDNAFVFGPGDGTGGWLEQIAFTNTGKLGVGLKNPSFNIETMGSIGAQVTTDVNHSVSLMNKTNSYTWSMYQLASTDSYAPNGFTMELCPNATCIRPLFITQSGVVANSVLNIGDGGTPAVPGGTGVAGTALNWVNNAAGYAFQLSNLGTSTSSNGMLIYSAATDVGTSLLTARSGTVNRFSVKADGSATLSGTLAQSSDIRLKQNFQNIENPLDKVLQLRGLTYEWKQDVTTDRSRQLGLIAQEVEKVFPEAVKTNDQGIKAVTYSNLIAPVIEALRELKTTFFSRQEKVERELASVKEENAALKDYLCKKDPEAPFCRTK